MLKHKKKKTGIELPEYRKPTTPPPPPTSGSNATKPNPNYVPPESAKRLCFYETPCGWCTKWDKKCDKKIGCEKPQRGLRVKINPIDDAIDVPIETLINKICTSESDHEWYCCGISTAGSTYRCKKCYAYKTVPYATTEINTSSTITARYDNLTVTFPIKDSADHMWNNNNEYDYKEN